MVKKKKDDGVTDITKLMTSQKSSFSELANRMDNDVRLWQLEDFKLKDSNGKAIPKVENVTRNKPQVVANHILSKLNTSSPRWTVKSRELDDQQTTYIENFLEDLIRTIDYNMTMREIPSLQLWAFQQAGMRGRIPVRVTIRKDPEKSGRIGLPDVTPMDARYLTYASGVGGIENFTYYTFRSAGQVNDRYGLSLADGDIEIRDHWNKSNNVIFIGSKQSTPPGVGRTITAFYTPQDTKTSKNTYGYVPAVISIVPLGLFLADANNIRWHGESWYSMLRDTFDDMNKQASIVSTINMRSLKNAMTLTGNTEDDLPLVPEGDPGATGAITPLKKGEKLENLEVKDVNQAAQFMFKYLKEDEQSGGISDNVIGAGDLRGVQLKQLEMAEGVLMSPILSATKMFYEELARMVIRQVVDQKLTMEVGMLGFEYAYEWSKLTGKYSIEVEFTPRDPVQDVANIAMAETAKVAGLSQETIDRDVLKLKNPAEEKARRDFERLRTEDPITDMFVMVHNLINERELAPESKKKRCDMLAKRTAQRCISMIVDERLEKEPGKVRQSGSPPKALGAGGQLAGLLNQGGGSQPQAPTQPRTGG